MSFLNPLALLGLASLAVPLLLLFFLNRKRVVLYWAAYQWMNETIVRHERQFQLNDLLKLLAKLLLLAALVLLVARPYLRSTGGGGRTLVVFDTSPSMAAEVAGQSRLDKARQDFTRFLQSRRGGIALARFDGKLAPVLSEFSSDRARLTTELAALEIGPQFAGARTLLSEIAADRLAREASQIVVFGDFQKHWYGDGPQIAADLKRLGKAYPMLWIPTDADNERPNCAIEALQLSREGAFLGRNCFVNVIVANGSAVPAKERLVSLYVDGKVQGRLVTSFAPHERKELPFALAFGVPGWHELRAELDADCLKADNERYAALEVPPALRVLAVSPPPGEDPFPYDVYVESAIAGVLPPGTVNYRRVPVLGKGAALDEVDVLLTVNLPLMAGTPLGETAREVVRRGGGLIAFLPGRAADEASAFGLKATPVPTAGPVAKDRLAVLERLKRKHGPNLADVIATGPGGRR